MNTNEFWANVDKRVQSTGERFGQAAFNLLADHRPSLARIVQGTDMDPFYVPAGREFFDKRIMDFADFLVENL